MGLLSLSRVFSLVSSLLFVILHFLLNVASDSTGEAHALLKWKATLQNHNTSLLPSWTLYPANSTNNSAHHKTKTSPCMWSGISCNHVGSVTHVNLAGLSLRGKSASRPHSAAHAPVHNPPQPVARASPPAVAQDGNGSMVGGVGATVADGSDVAHRAVDAVLGPRVIHHETVTSSSPAVAPAPVSAQNASSLGGANACGGQFKTLQDCLNNYRSDIGKCQFYMDMLQECRRSSGTAALGA